MVSPSLGLVAALLLTFHHVAAQQRTTIATCNANNCLRQVRASAFPARPTAQDCSKFQIRTEVKTTTISAARAKRDAATIPAYASNCNSVAYASACSCIGIPASTVTVVTTTTAAAASSPSPSTPSPPCGYLQVVMVDIPTEPAYNGKYLVQEPTFLNVVPDAETTATAQLFRLVDGQVQAPALEDGERRIRAFNILDDGRFQPVFFDDAYSAAILLDCVIGVGNILSCGTQPGGLRGGFYIESANRIGGDLYYSSEIDNSAQLRFIPNACPA